ncbi:glycosyltransferase family 2 protein [Cellulomonas carbonis]|nr:glycosyltransferase family 2 protein [Cellulomonas carbonis]GGC11281.1 glycosyl transferase [Cellulomonas carbonis]
MVVEPLGVVVPVMDEERWVRRCVAALHAAAEVAGITLDVLVVDDGSTDATPAVLDEMADRGLVRVHHQPNRGRFEARRTGLEMLTTEDVLLVDSRVLVDPGAFAHVQRLRAEDPSARVWNGHVEVDTSNPYAAFWSGITRVGWRAYFARPRHVSYGPEEFDRYPKGTTMFLAPRRTLLEAAGAFTSLYDDVRLASDDTRMLREVARAERIHLSPGFSCRYHGRDSLQGWLRQAWFRGTTFVDGYLGDAGRAVPVAAGLTAAAAVAGALAVRRPRTALAAAAAGCAGLAGLTAASGGTAREVRAVAGLAVPFAAVFGAGVARGLALVLRSR